MNFEHVSVMLMPTVDMLGVREGGVYVDGTLGGGGHSAEILRRLNGTGHLYGIDRDNDALAAATERLGAAGNFTAVKGNFHDVKALLAERGVEKIDGMMIDLGVSSHQLDTAERGFSYHADAPLDMRMDQDQPLTAREIVNTWSAAEITRILRDYSEEKWAARIAQIICEHRAQKPLETTGDLVACVDAAIPKKVRMQDNGHSARRHVYAAHNHRENAVDIRAGLPPRAGKEFQHADFPHRGQAVGQQKRADQRHAQHGYARRRQKDIFHHALQQRPFFVTSLHIITRKKTSTAAPSPSGNRLGSGRMFLYFTISFHFVASPRKMEAICSTVISSVGFSRLTITAMPSIAMA